MSKVFCDKPWNHNYIHTNGKVRLCCTTIQNIHKDDKYKQFDMNNDSLHSYWNSDRMKEIRKNMINGKPTKDCQRCYEQESNGVQSLRSTFGMEKFIKQTAPDGTYHGVADTMQIQMGNICNLKCKMCSQMYSHLNGLELADMGKNDPDFLLWVKEQGAVVNNWTNELGKKEEWYKNETTKKELFEHISKNVTELSIIGGEPTLIPEFYELFEKCYSDDTLKDKNITIVSNLTVINPKMMKWLPKIKHWRIWASVDGVKERTEYIRYPSRWPTIVKNLNFYKDQLEHGNGKITLSPAIQLLNIDQLDDIIKWWKDFAGGEMNYKFDFTWLATVWYPKICNFDIAPQEWKDKVADKLEKFDHDDPFYQNMIKNLRSNTMDNKEKTGYIKSFMRYNDAQDKFRNLDKTWRKLLPDLEQAMIDHISKH